ncbi:acyl-CoA dehydrogenase family protein [Aliiroseovarius sp.]|uniref:acyl-CoA dehydrogenase family protein n=1 Tax=Aliiroseovarius sp. TaxID=1872442 RepID=UPI002632A61B|nr:acyl-CoA dehydrogenase family protein [Aliiroseovarius sp.]
MTPFKAPLDDILFSLQVAGAGELPGYDAAFTREIGHHFAGFAEGEIAPLDEPGDRQGCRLTDGRVRMPDGFRDAYRTYAEAGWPGLTLPELHGGQGMDALTGAVVSEVFSGANHALQMVTGLVPGAARVLMRFGSADQQARHLPGLASGTTLATMCLTESGAGSDLSRIRCRADQSDGWRISGEKIFISGGDQDMSERILHLVLARTSADGIKGLSLFLCPSARSDGSRNAVTVTRIEEKMGLHASPTCQLAFDGAEAELIGDEGQGLAAMFTMMDHARLDVALQGVAHAARAYDISRTYAAERVQGRGMDGAPVTLDGHADVRRMLEQADGLALGARAMAHLALVTMARGGAPDLVDFMTPLTKVYCTEAGMRAADLGMQVLGGYGYLSEYRVEQTCRDTRITAIYEGANGIHERALVTRLLPGAAGQAFAALLRTEAAPEVAKLWAAARTAILSDEAAAAKVHEFTALTAQVLLSLLWPRVERQAMTHPDPERIRRVAVRARGETHRRIAFHAGAILP